MGLALVVPSAVAAMIVAAWVLILMSCLIIVDPGTVADPALVPRRVMAMEMDQLLMVMKYER